MGSAMKGRALSIGGGGKESGCVWMVVTGFAASFEEKDFS